MTLSPVFIENVFPSTRDLAFAIKDRDNGVEGGCVLGDPFIFIERESRDAAALPVDDHPARDRPIRIVNKFGHVDDFSLGILALIVLAFPRVRV